MAAEARIKTAYGPVLVGMRGAGKTTVARLLAALLGLSAVDSDEEIERRSGTRIDQLIEGAGEPHFRRLERTVLLGDLLQRQGVVVATGGGAVLDADVRRALAARETVWLRAPAEVLARRIAGSSRPRLTTQPMAEELVTLLAERERLYRKAATLEIDTAARSAHDVAMDIAEALQSRAVAGPVDSGLLL